MIPWDRTKGRPEPIAALNKIPELDTGEPLVDLRIAAPSVRIPKPQTIPYARLQVAQMVEEAADHLPEGVFIMITDAWRPLQRQRMIYEWLSQCALEAFPNISHTSLRRKVCRFVAPIDQKAPPGHCTGAAIDVNLVDASGEPLDVCSPYQRFGSSPTYVLGLSDVAQRNRSLLVDTMLGVGFSNCRDEWWHYSYGDAGWAVRLGMPTCCYGSIDLDPKEYEENQRLWVEAFAERTNPFLEQVRAK